MVTATGWDPERCKSWVPPTLVGKHKFVKLRIFFANSAAHAIRDSWAVLSDSRLGAPGGSEMLYRASPHSPVRPGTVLTRLRLRLVSNSDRGTLFTSCAGMSELLRVYRRLVCVSPAVMGWNIGSKRSAPPALRLGAPICEGSSPSSSYDHRVLPSWLRSKSPRFDPNRIRFDEGPCATSASILFRESAGA